MSAPIPVFSNNPKAVATPKLRALVKFPGNVEATNGISVAKANGVWTFELDYSQFAAVSSLPSSLTNYVLNYDTLTRTYTLVPTQTLTGKADVAYVDNADALRVLKSGDTMTGNLTITKTSPLVYLNSTDGTGATLEGAHNGVARWQVYVTGWGTPDDFSIVRFNDAGTFLDAPLSIERATGSAKFTGKIVAAGASTTTIPGLGNTATGFYVGTEGTPAFMTVSRGQTECAHFNINASGENLVFYCSGVRVGTINVSPTATAYLTSSSAELKEDLRVFDAGRIVDNTNVYDFKWKSTGERAYGVIAQQANEVYPTAVTHNEERDWWGINYQAYIPILLQEMKALRARVAELEDKLSAKPS